MLNWLAKFFCLNDSKCHEKAESLTTPQEFLVGSRDSLAKQFPKFRTYHSLNPDKIGSHQLDAHFDACVTLSLAPEPWELYESARVYGLPRTKFYQDYRSEIILELAQFSTLDLLMDYATNNDTVMESLTSEERHKHGFGMSEISFYDYDSRVWSRFEGRTVVWADARDVYRKIVNEEPGDALKRAQQSLAKMSKKLKEKPTERLKENYKAQKAHVSTLNREYNLEDERKRQQALEIFLNKIEKYPSFPATIFPLLRLAENAVRKRMSVPLVGEGWVSETALFYRVKQMLPDKEVVQHGQPEWLGRQHLDIWLPEFSIAIEYHGIQHFEATDRFGGEEAFRKTQLRDERKRKLCQKNGVRLIEIRYDQVISDEALFELLNQGQSPRL